MNWQIFARKILSVATFITTEAESTFIATDVQKNILANGGEIFFALEDGVPVGCCALVHHVKDNQLGEWELAKMAVSKQSQGKGIGSRLMEKLITEARKRNITRIYLEGNTRLKPSITMYRKFGFHEIPIVRQSYERVDIIMEWRKTD